ncbi:cAMP-specific 3',5'-cyclic phosphodiesterase [Striga asiatica]|uniref:cAMP-specific 3',5'-cyclic phosphodiesterase n=1 Tax=Striga asiatica TaxID=4170 RepID=A0A5A7QWH6_STRAF|nr:cAMP-specific 3',5'-cyclic phosphodiesterase [Striga asiatica]
MPLFLLMLSKNSYQKQLSKHEFVRHTETICLPFVGQNQSKNAPRLSRKDPPEVKRAHDRARPPQYTRVSHPTQPPAGHRGLEPGPACEPGCTPKEKGSYWTVISQVQCKNCQ